LKKIIWGFRATINTSKKLSVLYWWLMCACNKKKVNGKKTIENDPLSNAIRVGEQVRKSKKS
jgi:hypothetical protein